MSVHPKKLSRELLWRHRDLRRQEFSNWIYDRKNGISATVNPRNVYSNHLELWTAICHAGPPVWYRGAFGKCWDSRRGREGGREHGKSWKMQIFYFCLAVSSFSLHSLLVSLSASLSSVINQSDKFGPFVAMTLYVGKAGCVLYDAL